MRLNPYNLTGKTLNQKYEIIERIGQGEGGMGVVYLARQPSLSRQVAIKIFSPRADEPIDEQSYRVLAQRFLREAQLYADFQHPNIMSIFENGEQDGLTYMVMPFYSGGNLAKLLKENGPLPDYEILQYLKQIASALKYIHGKRVTHRDIKPQNLLLGDERRLILSDFGIARTQDSYLTQRSPVWVSPSYAAPEVIANKTVDCRADIYSLGVVIFELYGGSLEQSGSQPTIPPAVYDVICKATTKKPKNRYKSAGEFEEAFRMAIESPYNAPTLANNANTSRQLYEITLPFLDKSFDGTPWEGASADEHDERPQGPLLLREQRNLPPKPTSEIPPTVPVRPRSRLPRLITIGIAFVILLLIGGIILTPQVTGFINYLLHPPTLTAQQADATVLQYYNYWNMRNYQKAYNLLDSGYQNEQGHSYNQELPIYEQTLYSCVKITDTTSPSDDTFQVAIIDNAIEVNSPGPGTVANLYKLDYIVKQEQGSPRLTPEHFHSSYNQGMCQPS